ncbi:MAG: TRAP transporter small permease [Synergistetes bacterium]|nr:TRAP transporter small permease [Synergistota bacterium]
MFVWFSFIGTSLAVAEGAHFCVEVLFVRFPPRMKHYVELLIYILIMLVAGLMIHKGILFVWVNRTQLMTILPFSMSWPYLALPVSGAFIFIHSLHHFLRTLSQGGEMKCQCSSS